MVLLLIISAVLLSVFFAISLVNIFLGPDLRTTFVPDRFPSISVLIPARNEEDTIGICLKSMQQQHYPEYEIIVLDDGSTDKTAEIVREIASGDKRIRLLAGSPLPGNWLGKNWACHQLSEQASGEVLIFADADTWHNENALRNTIGWMRRYKLDGLSAFSQQVMKRFSERMMVPWIDLILYTLLPLWTVYLFPFRSLSAANGQWIAFTRKAYDKLSGHEAVKSEVVEDVALFRTAKKVGLRVMTVAGTGMIYCRMYSSMRQIWSGFTKILYGLTGNSPVIFSVFLVFIIMAYVYPVYGLIADQENKSFLYLISFALLVRVINAWKFRHPLPEALFLHPVSALVLVIMALNSFVQARWGKVVWKGRAIEISINRSS